MSTKDYVHSARPSDQNIIVQRTGELGLLVFMLAIFTSSNNVATYALSALLAFTFVLILFISSPNTALFPVPAIMWMLLLWILLSCIWSPTPLFSFLLVVRASTVVVLIFYGLAIVGWERGFRIFFISISIGILLQYGAVFFSLEGLHGRDDPLLVGAWRGFFAHKNEAGSFAAVATLLFLRAFVTRRKALSLVMVIISGLFLFMTQSMTSILVLAFGVFFLGYWSAVARSEVSRFATVFLAGIVLAAVVVAIAQSKFLQQIIFGDDFAFTGRVGLWKTGLAVWLENPVFGQGFRSVFGNPEVSLNLKAETPYAVLAPHPHNAYVDFLSGTGMVGLVLAIGAAIVQPVARVFHATGQQVKSPSSFCGAVLLLFSIRSFFEGGILQYDNAAWVLWLFVIAIVQKTPRRVEWKS